MSDGVLTEDKDEVVVTEEKEEEEEVRWWRWRRGWREGQR